MSCIPLGDGGHLCMGGPEHIIETSKGQVRFEMHRFCGPMPCDRYGNGRHLPDRHPFWAKVQRWIDGGQQMNGNHCVVPPLPPKCAECEGRGHTGERIRIKRQTGYVACPSCHGSGSFMKGKG